MTNIEIKNKLKSSISYMKNGAGYLAKQFNTTVEVIKQLKEEIKNESVNTSYLESKGNVYEDSTTGIEDTIAQHGMINNSFEIKEISSRLMANGKFLTSVKAKKKNDDFDINEVFNRLENFTSTYKSIKKEPVITNNPGVLVINITDYHLDKLNVKGETLSKKIEIYKDIVYRTLCKAKKLNDLEEIVYVISNDFLHTDNYQNMTTKGTPQMVNSTWYDAYEEAFNLQVEIIELLNAYCNKLTIVHVPSNHARTKEYYLSHALKGYFKTSQIIFMVDNNPTKAITIGNTFLGFHHGDIRDVKELITYFSCKYKELWGKSKFVEIALGDKHHRKEWSSKLSKNELNGVRTFILPSSSSADVWHKDSLYDLAIQAAVSRLYDYNTGYCAEIEIRL